MTRMARTLAHMTLHGSLGHTLGRPSTLEKNY